MSDPEICRSWKGELTRDDNKFPRTRLHIGNFLKFRRKSPRGSYLRIDGTGGLKIEEYRSVRKGGVSSGFKDTVHLQF